MPENGKIVGGHGTTIEAHPFQISLQYWEEHSCGGSILDENTILTAAHCVEEYVILVIIYITFKHFFNGETTNIVYYPKLYSEYH